MDIGQILTSIVSSLLGIVLAGQFVRWQYARAERDAAAGRQISVPASVRSPGRRRLTRMWRHGTIHIHGNRVIWTPRTPWGRALTLGRIGFGGLRSPEGPLRWQLPSAAVVVPCFAKERAYELAVISGSVKYLHRAHLAA